MYRRNDPSSVSKQRFAREVSGQRLCISDRMTAREHELHDDSAFKVLEAIRTHVVNKSLRVQVRKGCDRQRSVHPGNKVDRPPGGTVSNRLKLLANLAGARGLSDK